MSRHAVRRDPTPPAIGLSDLSVTEFVSLARMGFVPRGLVLGVAVYDAGWGSGLLGITGEVVSIGRAMRAARNLAVHRMRQQAEHLGAEGVVGVRLEVEHHVWRGGHNIARMVAVGTAIAFDREHAPPEFREAPSLKVGAAAFTSDLSGQDFVTLMRAGYRPVSVAVGSCTYEVSATTLLAFKQSWNNVEIPEYTQAFMNARETAMQNLAEDLHREFPPGHADSPIGVVGMTVREEGREGVYNVVEYIAIGTAVARLAANDPRRAPQLPAPVMVVPLDV